MSEQRKKIRRRLLHQSALGGKTHFYTMIPDPLNQDYIDGKVNDTLFRLIYTLLAQSPDFWITRHWLEARFSPNTLKKYLPLIIKAGIVTVDQEAMNMDGKSSNGRHANVYHTCHPDDWDMSIICEVPRTGQVTNTSEVNDCEKPNDISNTSEVNPCSNTSEVNPSEVNPSEVKDILNTNLNQTNLNHSHTQREEGVKSAYLQKAEEFSERLKSEHGILTAPNLLSHYLGLIYNQNRKQDLGWMESTYPEWSLYLAAQRNHARDPALTLFNWAKNYREPKSEKSGNHHQKSKPANPRQDKVYKETTEEEMMEILKNG